MCNVDGLFKKIGKYRIYFLRIFILNVWNNVLIIKGFSLVVIFG